MLFVNFQSTRVFFLMKSFIIYTKKEKNFHQAKRETKRRRQNIESELSLPRYHFLSTYPRENLLGALEFQLHTYQRNWLFNIKTA